MTTLNFCMMYDVVSNNRKKFLYSSILYCYQIHLYRRSHYIAFTNKDNKEGIGRSKAAVLLLLIRC